MGRSASSTQPQGDRSPHRWLPPPVNLVPVERWLLHHGGPDQGRHYLCRLCDTGLPEGAAQTLPALCMGTAASVWCCTNLQAHAGAPGRSLLLLTAVVVHEVVQAGEGEAGRDVEPAVLQAVDAVMCDCIP